MMRTCSIAVPEISMETDASGREFQATDSRLCKNSYNWEGTPQESLPKYKEAVDE
jgi:hypothetical protein